MTEEAFLRNLSEQYGVRSAGRSGVGDDCAWVDCPAAGLLITQDTFIETIHFPPWIDPQDLISRALAASLSDINAMGAKGTACFMSIGTPDVQELQILAGAVRKELDRYDLWLAGGDTVRSPIRTLTFTLAGIPPSGIPPVFRSGARPGDRIYLSGPLGGSSAGLDRIWKGTLKAGGNWIQDGHPEDSSWLPVLNRFLTPQIPYPLGWDLNRKGAMNAAIDISDGLAIDLQRLCRTSGTGAKVHVDRIPRFEGCSDLDVQEILSSGEEFELLWTSGRDLSFPCIGEITGDPGVIFLEEDRILDVPEPGFDHFSTNSLIVDDESPGSNQG